MTEMASTMDHMTMAMTQSAEESWLLCNSNKEVVASNLRVAQELHEQQKSYKDMREAMGRVTESTEALQVELVRGRLGDEADRVLSTEAAGSGMSEWGRGRGKGTGKGKGKET